MLTEIPDDELGPLRMHNVFPRLSATPGTIRHAGRPIGADNDGVFGPDGLGRSPEQLQQLRDAGAI
jgi:hypothetical protein